MIEAALIDEGWPHAADWEALVRKAVAAAVEVSPHGGLAAAPALIEVAVRLTDDAAVHALNAAYRGKDAPTNVLSFPMVAPDLLASLANTDDGEVLLGDIVLALGVCQAEATERGISLADHATHLVAHGMLHLLGYDHMDEAEAEAMEELERAALRSLGLADPYPR